MIATKFDPVAERENFIKLSMVAAAVERHTDTVRRWIVSGCCGRKLPAARIGGRLFVHRRELDEFLAALSADSRDGAKVEDSQ